MRENKRSRARLLQSGQVAPVGRNGIVILRCLEQLRHRAEPLIAHQPSKRLVAERAEPDVRVAVAVVHAARSRHVGT